MRFILGSIILLALAAAAAALHFWSPHATLRVTTGAVGTDGQLFMSAFMTETTAEYPRVKFKTIPVDDLKASAKAIEEGRADLALIRSDVSPPANGQTIAIVRRDAVAFVLPPKSTIDSISKLSGKVIGIPQGRMQGANAELLDLVLTYYDVQPKDVHRIILPPDEMVAAVRQHHVAAILAVGPIGPGEVANAVSATAKGSRGTPTILAFSDADAFNKRFPAFESLDVPEGGFRSRPATPDDTVTTLAITYRLVSPDTMLDLTAGAIGRSLFTGKRKLMALTPLASQIEAPDTDDKNPVLPVHPGVANYINNGEQSFFDEFQSYFYLAAAALSVLGSLVTVAMGRLRSSQLKQDQNSISQFIRIADQARGADVKTLDALDDSLHQLVDLIVASGARAGENSTMTLAINHARHSVASRRAVLSSGEM